MTQTVRMPDLATQLAEIVADPTGYVRRTREMSRTARERRTTVNRPHDEETDHA